MSDPIPSSLAAGTVDIIPAAELTQKLATGRQLTIKLGADPTAPDLHLGHAVVLRKLRDFQNAGHRIVFVIGDFTVRIGDPTGRSKTRPPLSDAEIMTHSATYFEQVGKILDKSKIEVRYNSEWLAPISSKEWISLCAKFTLARLIEREDFAQRLAQHQPIGFHELLYPILQGYDSVALRADVELGGTDQTFNLLVGRFLQEQFGQEPQVVMTVPLLEGLNGTQKMSKSLGNYVGLAEPADQAFGKLMSISDDLMWHYDAILLRMPSQEISHLQRAVIEGSAHPMELKLKMAHDIVAEFWSTSEAVHAHEQFIKLFRQHDYEYAQQVPLSNFGTEQIWIIDILKKLNVCTSSSEGRRLIEGGAVHINGTKIVDASEKIILAQDMIIKAGKHKIFRIV
jgi:tyrosyl-tRNA synthetase